MMVKVFQSNANGKIEFTRAELEKLLNEVYNAGHDAGYSEGKSNQWTWTSPYSSTSTSTINSTNSTGHSSTVIDDLTCNGATEAVKVTAEYRAESEEEAKQMNEDFKKEARDQGYILTSFAYTKKEKKSKGEIIDDGYLVKVVKTYGGFWDG